MPISCSGPLEADVGKPVDLSLTISSEKCEMIPCNISLYYIFTFEPLRNLYPGMSKLEKNVPSDIFCLTNWRRVQISQNHNETALLDVKYFNESIYLSTCSDRIIVVCT